MKEYYIYDSEFRELKRTGAIATVLFAVGSACLGFAINVQVGMAFAEKIPDAVKAEWSSYKTTALILTILFYFFGVLTSLNGYNQVERIKSETSHGDEKYEPKSRYKIALWALVFLAFGVVGYVIRSLTP